MPPAEAAGPEASTAYSALVDELRRNAIALGHPVSGTPRQEPTPMPPPAAFAPPVAPPLAAPPPQRYVGSYIMGPDGRRIFVTSP